MNSFNEKLSACSFHDSKAEKAFQAKMLNKGVHKRSKISADFKSLGFWREADGFGWSLFKAADHLNLRAEQRDVDLDDLSFALVLMLEAIENSGELPYVLNVAKKGKRVVINDEVNGFSYVLMIRPDIAEIALLTVWRVASSARKTNSLTVTLFRNGRKMVFTEKDEENREIFYARHILAEPLVAINA